MAQKIHILLFYKYTDVKNPKDFANTHLEMCKKLGVLGKVLVAKEGINGSVSGTKAQVEKYKKELKKDKRFSDVQFKEDVGKMRPFAKMSVLVKREIVRLGKRKTDWRKTGKHISPKEFLDIYKKKEDVIILDARNNYESRVGKFKNAITPDITTFREFPKVATMLKDKKNKKIVMYCTGGIRCEKASAYLIQKGFKDVSQLDGGIIKFGKQFPDTVWEGKCFVFDKRLLVPINSKDKPIAKCEICNIGCDLYRNCRNLPCNKLFIMCPDCENKMNGCCSNSCLKAFREYCLNKAKMNQPLMN